MIYTLTLNPALDYDIYMDKFQEGDLNLSKEVNIRAGGKGINVSKLLSNLDIKSKALGYTAGFTGDFIKKNLYDEGIESDFVELDGITRINVKINNSSKETEIAGLSPNITKEAEEKLIEKISGLQKDDILILSGSIPESIEKNIYKKLAAMLPEETKIVLDTRGSLLKENLNNNFLIKPNIAELEEMFGTELKTTADIVEKCGYFLEKGVKNIIVSMGGKGALFVNKEGAYTADVPKGKLINSVGAGDSMVAGFIAGTESGKSPEDSFRLAVASGSATAYSYGLGEKDLIYRLYNEITLKKEGV
ncbi:1-phosphofructokinase [Sebaldella sp. S0638]|uniref:1-phosphofructokinase n=1 Tax=Sebaldella sp. S0638 TaxID=2957809 RepID=UPI00209FA4AF|nr:1-phosphofructokinase [Sebaldella sp. S0638]MCP1225386.1 1-phosphofructokinase [Sebaldella sp. S0638]